MKRFAEEFDYEIVKNPLIFEQNRLKAHADMLLYSGSLNLDGENNVLRKCLNGSWKFSYAENYEEAVKDFWTDNFDCSGWDEIKVPAHIQMEGYDRPHYTNTTYPWEGREWIVPGEIPVEFNPIASYITDFELPDEWTEDEIRISFQGVESGFACWLNGNYIGYSEDSFDPADFDLTSFVRKGSNRLAVMVFKWTASSWCEDQDFFRFSGIYRDVFIYPVKKIHMEDIKIETDISIETDIKAGAEAGTDDCSVAGSTGRLILSLECKGNGRAVIKLGKAKKGIFYPVIEGEKTYDTCAGRENGGTTCEKAPDYKEDEALLIEESIEINEGNCKFISQWMDNIQLWSAEKPELYVLKLELYDENGILTEAFSEFVGFRKFEMKNGLMLLNGERIVFKGVNRHEFSSKSGRVAGFEDIVTDVTIMKRNNINAIRTSHYPNNSRVYEKGRWMPGIYYLCDCLGLYMIAENNLESHGTMEAFERGHVDRDYMLPDSKEEWLPMLLDRVNSCYCRDKNHPSILIWSVGNESCGGSVPAKMAEEFRRLDSGRLVHYEGIMHDRSYPESSDMESQMYPHVADIERFLAEHKEKPFICCEYTHAMGNSCGGMQLYTELAYREDRYQGGFIWDFADQTIIKKDRYGKEFMAYGGDFGDRPTDAEFSGNGIVYGDRKPSPKLQSVKYNYQNIVACVVDDYILVENRNLFTGTDEFDCLLYLYGGGEPVAQACLETCVRPGEKGSYDIPEIIKNEMTRVISDCGLEASIIISFVLKENKAWAEAGYEVAFGQHIYKKKYEKRTCDRPVTYVRGNNNIGVKGEDFRVIFGRMTDGMISYVYKEKEMLKAVPKPNFWRAPTNNDSGNLMTRRLGQWKLASMYGSCQRDSRFEDVEPLIEQTEYSVKLTYTFHLPTIPSAEVLLIYEVFADGCVEMNMSYDPVTGLPDMPEFGVIFKMDADYDRLKWYGLGPEESYADRQEGAKLGIYENRVADNMAQYHMPQECGNKCGVRWAEVTDKEGRGLRFEGDELSFSALPYTPHELENATHAYELPQIHNTVVRVAKAQLGVGGDDSWGAPVLPEYHLDISKKLEFSFRFRGIG